MPYIYIASMKTRMSNYKNHLRTQFKSCEMAQHFKECGLDIHSVYAASEVVNTRSKKYLEESNQHLSQQLKVILIERVDLTNIETTAEKRKTIEVREGFWQTQLRTLSHYGGLNKKDERKLHNKRLAHGVSKSGNNETGPSCTVPVPATQELPPSAPVRQSARLMSKTSCSRSQPP